MVCLRRFPGRGSPTGWQSYGWSWPRPGLADADGLVCCGNFPAFVILAAPTAPEVLPGPAGRPRSWRPGS